MSERRHFYRKRLTTAGYLVLSDAEYQFSLLDLSLRGMQAWFETEPPLQTDQVVGIRLPDQGINGVVSVIWIKPEPEGGYVVGFAVNRLDGVGDNSYWFREED
jgi:hypothetical protein